MYAMLVKEMRQYFRSISLKINVVLVIAAWLLVYGASRIQLPDAKEMQQILAGGDNGEMFQTVYILCYFFGILAVAFAGLLMMLGSSCGRWRVELGDPAFSPGITTCIPPVQLALGKWSALMIQLGTFVFAAGIMPTIVLYNLESVSTLLEYAKDAEANMCQIFGVPQGELVNRDIFSMLMCRMILVWFCSVVAWGSVTLAVCSLKPASRSKFDVGTVAAMLVVGPQISGLIVGAEMDKFELCVIIRTAILVTACLSLITSGVSAPGSNRLFFFKLWMFVSTVFIVPVFFDLSHNAVSLQLMAVLFLVCSLMERTVQSRRVLSQMRNPLVAAAAFPFTTGSLNSIVLSVIFMVCSFFVDKVSFEISRFFVFFIWAAIASFCNMCGYIFERRNWKFKRFTVFLLLGVAFLVIVTVIRTVGYWDVFDRNKAVLTVLFAALTIIFNLPLIINYNYRKKGL